MTVNEDCVVQDRIKLYAGGSGTIGWRYPVTGSVIELSKEAHVEGLRRARLASIGVPWAMLSLSKVS